MRRHWKSLLISAAIVLSTTLFPSSAGATTSLNTTNFAGVWTYGSGIGTVSGFFRIPYVDGKCGTYSNVAAWVGMGGTNYGPYGSWRSIYPFVQNGFTLYRNGWAGSWYEMFDAYGHDTLVNSGMVFHSGDLVKLMAAFSADHSRLTFRWEDRTRGTAKQVVIYNAQRYFNGRTADWVMERAPILGRSQPLVHMLNVFQISGAAYGGAGQAPWIPGLQYTSTVTSMYSWHPVMSMMIPARTTFNATWRACS